MKKKIIISILMMLMLLIPNNTFASEYKIINHVIDAMIEIGGGLNVKELIILDGKSDYLNRKLNYYSFGDNFWDGKLKVDYEGNEFYNGYNLSLSEVAVYKYNGQIDINSLKPDNAEILKEFNLEKPTKKGYSFKDNKKGIVDLKVLYPFDGKYAIYINYTVGNAVVKHNDIKEMNYSFKNLNYDCNNTIVRVITPYPVEKDHMDLYNVWVHGNQNGLFQELEEDSGRKLGIYGTFKETTEFNVRMTFPQQYVGVDMYLNNSGEDALEEIKEVEQSRKDKTESNKKVIKNIIYGFYGVCALYIIASIILVITKTYDIKIFALLMIFALLICLFNTLFYKLQYWYLDLVVFCPIISYITQKIIIKKNKNVKRK